MRTNGNQNATHLCVYHSYTIMKVHLNNDVSIQIKINCLTDYQVQSALIISSSINHFW